MKTTGSRRSGEGGDAADLPAEIPRGVAGRRPSPKTEREPVIFDRIDTRPSRLETLSAC